MATPETDRSQTVTKRGIILTAASLVTDDNTNPEYDRGVVELVTYLVGLEPDDKETTLALLRELA